MLKNVDNENKEIYLLGDLNCNLLDQSNSSAKHLHSIMQLYQLTQVIDKPTRITESSSTLLDVCITSCPERIAFHDVINMGVSDDSLIYVVRKINSYLKPHASKKVKFRSFKHFNVENFKINMIAYYAVIEIKIAAICQKMGFKEKLKQSSSNKSPPPRLWTINKFV